LECWLGSGDVDSTTVETKNFYLDSAKISVTLDKKYSWIKCNRDFKGFYVTDYNKANYDTLLEVVQKNPKVILFSIF
jgi:hypothetical protein